MGNCMQNSGVGSRRRPFPSLSQFHRVAFPKLDAEYFRKALFAFFQGKAAVVTPLEYTPYAQKGKLRRGGLEWCKNVGMMQECQVFFPFLDFSWEPDYSFSPLTFLKLFLEKETETKERKSSFKFSLAYFVWEKGLGIKIPLKNTRLLWKPNFRAYLGYYASRFTLPMCTHIFPKTGRIKIRMQMLTFFAPKAIQFAGLGTSGKEGAF